MQLDSEHPTGVVNVNFINNEPHYEIVENSAYDFIQSSCLPSLKKDAILYHGTLALRSQSCVETLQKIKADISPSIFLDVNLRTPWWNLKSVELLFKRNFLVKIK